MFELKAVHDCTLLTQSKVYMIQGTLYRYRYETGNLKHPSYLFTPLNGQRKKADLQLPQQKVYSRVYEVPGLYKQVNAQVEGQAIQLSLF